MKRIALFLTALVTLLGGVINVKAATTGSVIANGKTVNYSYEFTESGTSVTFAVTITSITDGDGNSATLDGLVKPAFYNGATLLQAGGGAITIGQADTYTLTSQTAGTKLNMIAKYDYAAGGSFQITADEYTVVGDGSSAVTPVNLALNCTTMASSNNNHGSAVDGNAGTRYESAQSDPQYWQVDLGEAKTFNTIKIIWEGAYGKTFTIDAGDNVDGEGWLTGGTTIASVTDQHLSSFPYTQTIYVGNTTARYIKFNGLARGTDYGYSFCEFEVYDDTSYAPTSITITGENRTNIGEDLQFTATATDAAGDAVTPGVTWSSSDTSVGTIDAAEGLFSPVAAGTTTITASCGGVTSNGITVTVLNTVAPTDVPGIISSFNDGTDTYTIDSDQILKIFTVDGNASGLSWQNYHGTTIEDATINGKQAKKFTNFNTVVGAHGEIDISDMDYLHVDVYPMDNINFTVFNSQTNQKGKSYAVTVGQWTSINIPKSEWGVNETTTTFLLTQNMDASFHETHTGDIDNVEVYLGNFYYFTTTAIPPATTPTAQNVMSIYSNAYATNYLQGIEVNNGGTVQNYKVAEGDEVKQVTGATTITIRHNEHDADPETYQAAYIAIYPTGSTTEVTLTPTFYNSTANTVSQTYSVIPGQWNYLSFRPADFRPEGYTGKDLFKLVVSQQAANTLFFDNFYYTSPNDLTAPVYASHTHMAAASYVVFNLNYTDDTDEGTLTFKIWNEYGGYEGDVTGKEGTNVRFRINNLDPETTYNYILKVSDEAGNTSADRQLTVTTPIVEGDLRVNDNPADPDAAKLTAAGMVYITGVWDTDKFIAIDQEYCATAYDLTEVDFRATGDKRLDRDHDYFTFNPNAILVSPKLNKFNINYVMYDRDGETLYGYNFDMIDGDFPAATFYSGNPLYSTVIAPGIENDKYTRGMDASKFLKLDPFTGFKKIVTGQNFAFSRNLNNGDGQGNDVFATVILPFAVDVKNSGVQGSDAPLTLYELSSAVADEGNNITLKFEEVTGVGVTNKPYLVKSNIDNGGGTIYFIDSNVPKTLTFPEGDLEAMKHVGASTEDNATLFGTYVTHEATSNGTEWKGYDGWYHTGIYGLAGGNTSLTLQEMAATETSGSIIPAWRSMVQLSNVAPGAKISLVFIDHEDEPSDPENPETPEVNPGEGETTAITRPATDSEINAVIGNVYSIDGRKVSSRGNSFMQLPAGIYIVNGKKVIVK